MAKGRGVDAVMDALAALKGQPASLEVREQIAGALANKINFVAAKAADLARQFKYPDLCTELSGAFERFMAGDKGCAAKTALARAALELECGAEAIFVKGVRHVQMEGSFGEPVDVAAELRGLCALGLVQVRHCGVMNELVELLVDAEPQARIGAIRALGNTGREDAALVLRLKVLSGDPEPDVLTECFAAMFQIAPRESMPFVARYLESNGGLMRDSAALAIGASRHPTACEVLRRQFQPGIDARFRATLFLAIATYRSPEAIEFLVSTVRTERPAAGVDAIAALALYRHDKTIQAKLESAVKDRGSDVVMVEYMKYFRPNT